MENYIPEIGDSFISPNTPYCNKDIFVRVSNEYGEKLNASSKLQMTSPVDDTMICAISVSSGRDITKGGVGSFVFIQKISGFEKVKLTLAQENGI